MTTPDDARLIEEARAQAKWWSSEGHSEGRCAYPNRVLLSLLADRLEALSALQPTEGRDGVSQDLAPPAGAATRDPQPPRPERKPCPYVHEAFGILNPFGDIWSPHFFASEQSAHGYLERFWALNPPMLDGFTIIPVIVTLNAATIPDGASSASTASGEQTSVSLGPPAGPQANVARTAKGGAAEDAPHPPDDFAVGSEPIDEEDRAWAKASAEMIFGEDGKADPNDLAAVAERAMERATKAEAELARIQSTVERGGWRETGRHYFYPDMGWLSVAVHGVGPKMCRVVYTRTEGETV